MEELANESQRTLKVKILYNKGINQKEAWSIITENIPNFSTKTFKMSWHALEISKGKTPNWE
ncbi:MAG: hypothetical protein BZ151_04055 [Desulfobacca sp. 4484_104]|nr:MAG: hypothetical protein BZ151_04055 [Desulfobacca sp. 4484_104]RLA89706.1 MAG: hypothetical protein DRG58_04400 [Deltaproteobacteria bacterium]